MATITRCELDVAPAKPMECKKWCNNRKATLSLSPGLAPNVDHPACLLPCRRRAGPNRSPAAYPALIAVVGDDVKGSGRRRRAILLRLLNWSQDDVEQRV